MNSVVPDKFVYGSDFPALTPKDWINDFSQYFEKGVEWGGRRRMFREENLARFFRLNAIKAMNLEKLRPQLVNRTPFRVIAK
jgi:predicted TIM-barrel fold metal-dependent hydrolase